MYDSSIHILGKQGINIGFLSKWVYNICNKILGGILIKATDRKLGTSSWFFSNDYSKKTLVDLKANGIDCIEITHGMIWEPDLKAIAKSITDAGLCVWSFHTPYGPFEENNLATFDKDLLEKTIKLQTHYLNLMA